MKDEYNSYMAVKYIVKQAIGWIVDFFQAWYIDGFCVFSRAFINLLFNLDRAFAFRVNAKNLLKPMYQDRSVIGHVMGFLFRSIRITMALVLYTATGIVFAVAYSVWAFIPIFLIIKIFNPNVFFIF